MEKWEKITFLLLQFYSEKYEFINIHFMFVDIYVASAMVIVETYFLHTSTLHTFKLEAEEVPLSLPFQVTTTYIYLSNDITYDSCRLFHIPQCHDNGMIHENYGDFY